MARKWWKKQPAVYSEVGKNISGHQGGILVPWWHMVCDIMAYAVKDLL